MAGEKDKATSELHSKRLELGIRASELQTEALKLNRDLLKAGATVSEVQDLHNISMFAW